MKILYFDSAHLRFVSSSPTVKTSSNCLLSKNNFSPLVIVPLVVLKNIVSHWDANGDDFCVPLEWNRFKRSQALNKAIKEMDLGQYILLCM